MYINSVAHYLPEEIVQNEYFLNVNGLSDEWIYSRTGIKTRTKASKSENTNTMGVEAVQLAIEKLPYHINDVDLIIGASYSPYDTVGTLAHAVQRKFNIDNARSVYISSACSSLINALEITEGYFSTGKASKALIIASEHNTLYNNETDEKSGHLWGDGAAAIFVSKDPINATESKVIDIYTKGLGHIGKGIEGVFLHPTNGGLIMPYGKDVFIHACKYMVDALEIIMNKNEIAITELDYVIAHQANMRIINHIAQELSIPHEKLLSNIENLGNTGCASTLIVFSQNMDRLKKNDLIAFTVFGGGYSTGSMLVRY